MKLICRKPAGKRLAAIYRQEIIQNVTLFTSQSAAKFYDKLFSSLDFTLPKAATGRRGFPKEAMVCAFIVMKCEGFSQITDLMDYLDNNRLIAHYCGFNIMKPLPSYWTYERFLRQLDNGELRAITVSAGMNSTGTIKTMCWWNASPVCLTTHNIAFLSSSFLRGLVFVRLFPSVQRFCLVDPFSLRYSFCVLRISLKCRTLCCCSLYTNHRRKYMMILFDGLNTSDREECNLSQKTQEICAAFFTGFVIHPAVFREG